MKLHRETILEDEITMKETENLHRETILGDIREHLKLELKDALKKMRKSLEEAVEKFKEERKNEVERNEEVERKENVERKLKVHRIGILEPIKMPEIRFEPPWVSYDKQFAREATEKVEILSDKLRCELERKEHSLYSLRSLFAEETVNQCDVVIVNNPTTIRHSMIDAEGFEKNTFWNQPERFGKRLDKASVEPKPITDNVRAEKSSAMNSCHIRVIEGCFQRDKSKRTQSFRMRNGDDSSISPLHRPRIVSKHIFDYCGLGAMDELFLEGFIRTGTNLEALGELLSKERNQTSSKKQTANLTVTCHVNEFNMFFESKRFWIDTFRIKRISFVSAVELNGNDKHVANIDQINVTLNSAKRPSMRDDHKPTKCIQETRRYSSEEFEEMERISRCKICLDDDASVVFLPCCHMVACEICASVLKRCAVCRSLIRDTMKVNLQ